MQALLQLQNNLGLFVGALTSGIIADRWGKNAFQFTLLFYSIFSLLSAFSWDATTASILRFFTGFGLGGELPVVSSYLSEFIPAKQRGRFIVLLESFWAYGGLIAAVIAYLIIPNWGWRLALAIGSIPALYVFVLRRYLPESPRYLAEKGKYEEAIKTLANFTDVSGIEITTKQEERKVSIIDLFKGNYAKRTVMLWLLWFGIVFGYYGAFIWLPSALAQKGLSLATSIYFSIIITAAQIPGYFLSAFLIDRIGRKLVLVSFLFLSFIFATLFAFASNSFTLILWGSLMSFFNLGAWGAVYAYTPENYPTLLRGTGTGAASSFGRVGGVIAPFAVGLALSGVNGFTYAYTLNAIMFFIACLSVLLLGSETKGLTLEQASK